MRTGLVALLVLVLGFAVGSVATATGGWQLVQSGEANGSGYLKAYVNVSRIEQPKALAVTLKGGQPATVTWRFTCYGPPLDLRPGVISIVSIATSERCKASGTATSEDATRLRLALLRK